jgi:putative endopeptidase
VAVADWKAYIRWNFIDELAPYLGGEFAEQNHRFYGAFLKGTEEMGDRRALILELVGGALGDIVGRLYVEEYFKPEAKAKMVELMSNIKKALAARIERLDWLGDATRKQALAKLEAMRIKVGYPDKWKDYTGLVVKRDSFARNLMRLSRYLAEARLGRYGEAPDPDEWPCPPQSPRAGYFPQRNEIIFTAGILQPPLLDLRADDAVIYGSIGMGIAHEMIHGFDDQGRKFDKDGNLNDWWTEEDAAEYGRRVKLLVEQYNAFAPFDDLSVDGELTLGENIADFGGLTVALDAYKLSLNGKVPEPVDGFTHEQRFFLAFARFFRGKIRDDALRRKIREDKHPWLEYRVNGAPFNVPEFYLAFDIRPTDRLYRAPEQRPVIW